MTRCTCVCWIVNDRRAIAGRNAKPRRRCTHLVVAVRLQKHSGQHQNATFIRAVRACWTGAEGHFHARNRTFRTLSSTRATPRAAKPGQECQIPVIKRAAPEARNTAACSACGVVRGQRSRASGFPTLAAIAGDDHQLLIAPVATLGQVLTRQLRIALPLDIGDELGRPVFIVLS